MMGNHTSSRSKKSSDACPRTKAIGDFDPFLPPGTYNMYQTHDNGARPFRVFVDEKDKVAVITLITPTEFANECYPFVVNKRFPFQKVWIGKSPLNEMTEFSRGHGPKFDGNSILFYLGEHEKSHTYMFVGDSIKVFRTEIPIHSFESPVGNSDVPYPFATSRDGKTYYLFAENVVLHSKSKPISDPYQIYYSSSEDRGVVVKPLHSEIIVPRLT